MAGARLAFLRVPAARRQQVRLSGVHTDRSQHGRLLHRLQDLAERRRTQLGGSSDCGTNYSVVIGLFLHSLAAKT